MHVNITGLQRSCTRDPALLLYRDLTVCVAVPVWHRVTLVKLTMHQMTHLDPIGEAVDAGALPNLQRLILASCHSLERLPSSLYKMTSLEHLNISECNSLTSLPPLPPSIRSIDVRGSTRLDARSRVALTKLVGRGVEVAGLTVSGKHGGKKAKAKKATTKWK